MDKRLVTVILMAVAVALVITAIFYQITVGRRPLDQDFHFGPGTVKVYTRAAPKTTSFRAEPCTSPPAAGPKARPSAHRR